MQAAAFQHCHLGVCACCGTDTVLSSGIVEEGGLRVASYSVKWTSGDPAHGMAWIVSFPHPDSGGEVSVSLAYSFHHCAFMVQELVDQRWLPEEMPGFGKLLDRSQVIGTSLAKTAFDIADAIWLTDPYVREFVEFALIVKPQPDSRQ